MSRRPKDDIPIGTKGRGQPGKLLYPKGQPLPSPQKRGYAKEYFYLTPWESEFFRRKCRETGCQRSPTVRACLEYHGYLPASSGYSKS